MFLQRNRADSNSISVQWCGISISISCCLSETATVQKWVATAGRENLTEKAIHRLPFEGEWHAHWLSLHSKTATAM